VRRISLWVGRVVLGLAGLLLLRVGLGLMADPTHAVTEQGIILPSASALTSMRAVGGAFLGVGLLVLGSALAERWLRPGLTLLAAFAGAVTLGRILGLALDGAAPFTLKVLKPEIALVVLSVGALLLSSRRQRTAGRAEAEPRGRRDAEWDRQDALR
jgi:uncharacterized protein DUF4345